MKISVYDTYVRRKDGRTMHFDILVPAPVARIEQVYAFGRQYLAAKGEAGQPLSSQECSFCHMEEATASVEADIRRQGYSIIEMEDCN